ncbi:MAG: hypothetical protein AAF914_14265, partial [Pseudomonadota bacterium]
MPLVSDVAKLKAVLGRTAADGVSIGRSARHFEDAAAGVALILDAIDTSVLGRRLTISFEGGDPLLVETAGRRLMRILAPLPDGVPAGVEPGAELHADEADTVAGMLAAACAGKATLRIASVAIPQAADPSEGGLSPAALRDAIGLAAPERPDRQADLNMDDFIGGIEASLLAALWIQDDAVSLVAGPEARATALSQWAAPVLERLLAPEFPLAAAFETKGIMAFCLPPG